MNPTKETKLPLQVVFLERCHESDKSLSSSWSCEQQHRFAAQMFTDAVKSKTDKTMIGRKWQKEDVRKYDMLIVLSLHYQTQKVI
jgi:hypothetical protein